VVHILVQCRSGTPELIAGLGAEAEVMSLSAGDQGVPLLRSDDRAESARRALLERFGSVVAIATASHDGLLEVPGVGVERARAIVDAFRPVASGA